MRQQLLSSKHAHEGRYIGFGELRLDQDSCAQAANRMVTPCFVFPCPWTPKTGGTP